MQDACRFGLLEIPSAAHTLVWLEKLVSKGPKYQIRVRASSGSISGIVIMVWGTYLTFGYLGPLGGCPMHPPAD